MNPYVETAKGAVIFPVNLDQNDDCSFQLFVV